MEPPTEAAFETAIGEAENLLSIHSAMRSGPGRRYREVSLNRAAVVLAVGAWQSFVEGSARDMMEAMRPNPANYSGPQDPKLLAARSEWQVANARLTNALGRFNTPSADNVREIYRFVGHDPYRSWTWTKGSHATSSRQNATKIDDWLRVRHAIAHGSGDLPDVNVISKTQDATPTLHKKNAEACVAFIRQLVGQTDRGI